MDVLSEASKKCCVQGATLHECSIDFKHTAPNARIFEHFNFESSVTKIQNGDSMNLTDAEKRDVFGILCVSNENEPIIVNLSFMSLINRLAKHQK